MVKDLEEFEIEWANRLSPISGGWIGGDKWHVGAKANTTFEAVIAMRYPLRVCSTMKVSQLFNNSLVGNLQYFAAPVDFANVNKTGIDLFQAMHTSSAEISIVAIESTKQLP